MYLIVVVVYYRSPIVYRDFVGFLRWIIQTSDGCNGGRQYFNQWFPIIVCFWMVYLLVLAKKLYQMTLTLETTTMFTNIATKLTVTARVFLIDNRTPMTIKVTA